MDEMTRNDVAIIATKEWMEPSGRREYVVPRIWNPTGNMVTWFRDEFDNIWVKFEQDEVEHCIPQPAIVRVTLV